MKTLAPPAVASPGETPELLDDAPPTVASPAQPAAACLLLINGPDLSSLLQFLFLFIGAGDWCGAGPSEVGDVVAVSESVKPARPSEVGDVVAVSESAKPALLSLPYQNVMAPYLLSLPA